MAAWKVRSGLISLDVDSIGSARWQRAGSAKHLSTATASGREENKGDEVEDERWSGSGLFECLLELASASGGKLGGKRLCAAVIKDEGAKSPASVCLGVEDGDQNGGSSSSLRIHPHHIVMVRTPCSRLVALSFCVKALHLPVWHCTLSESACKQMSCACFVLLLMCLFDAHGMPTSRPILRAHPSPPPLCIPAPHSHHRPPPKQKVDRAAQELDEKAKSALGSKGGLPPTTVVDRLRKRLRMNGYRCHLTLQVLNLPCKVLQRSCICLRSMGRRQRRWSRCTRGCA